MILAPGRYVVSKRLDARGTVDHELWVTPEGGRVDVRPQWEPGIKGGAALMITGGLGVLTSVVAAVVGRAVEVGTQCTTGRLTVLPCVEIPQRDPTPAYAAAVLFGVYAVAALVIGPLLLKHSRGKVEHVSSDPLGSTRAIGE